MDRIEQGGCKYIGVIKNTDLDKLDLNRNLQYGCSNRRVTWDGSCRSIYHDIDRWGSTRIGQGYKTGDIVTVHLDTDKKEVCFGLNGKKIETVVKYHGDYDLQAVVGFGPEKDTEQYTIVDCSWW